MQSLSVSLTTPAGEISAEVDVPSAFVPVTAIVPLLQRIGQEAMALEERSAGRAGQTVSCQKGCAACCRLLVPVSAPEAFALWDMIAQLPSDRRALLESRVTDAIARLKAAGLHDRLVAVAESTGQLTDLDLDDVNRAYYALRLPCPFLENELCSIYEHRPAACRELVVTSPPELCDDIEHNPVRALPVPIRISTALAHMWAEAQAGPARLIPLVLATAWAGRHEAEGQMRRPGRDWLQPALDAAARYLSQEFDTRAKERR